MGAKRQAKKQLEMEQELAKLKAKKAREAAAKAQRQAKVQANMAEARAARAARLEAMTPEQRAKTLKTEKITWAGGALVLVLFVGGCIALGATNDDDDQASDDAEETLSDDNSSSSDDDEFKAVSAFRACEGFVKDRLKSPSSATFRNPHEDDGEVQIDGTGDGPYTIASTVDADNGFGANIRISFVCKVDSSADGKSWLLQDVQLVE